MNTQALFGLSILMSLIAFGLVTKLYIWPGLRNLERSDALIALLTPNAFRFLGLSFLVPGVVSPALPRAFAVSAAYGDIIAAILATGAILAISRRAFYAIALVWLFNIWGTTDLFLAFYRGSSTGLDAAMLGAAFYIPTAIVPAYLIIHALIFRILVRPRM